MKCCGKGYLSRFAAELALAMQMLRLLIVVLLIYHYYSTRNTKPRRNAIVNFHPFHCGFENRVLPPPELTKGQAQLCSISPKSAPGLGCSPSFKHQFESMAVIFESVLNTFSFRKSEHIAKRLIEIRGVLICCHTSFSQSAISARRAKPLFV
jgi:hypothetical protein